MPAADIASRSTTFSGSSHHSTDPFGGTMSDFTISRIDDMEAVVFGSCKRARAQLGVESFGMQVIDMPPNADQYPSHDHIDDGQEEVFVVLRGSGDIQIDGERHRLDSESMIRVGPEPTRKI